MQSIQTVPSFLHPLPFIHEPTLLDDIRQLRSQPVPDQEFLRRFVSGRGIVVQVDAVARVRLDVSFKRPRCRKRFPHRARDRRSSGVCEPFRPTTVRRRHAVAAAEDEVLIYSVGDNKLVGGWSNNKVDLPNFLGSGERKKELTTDEDLDRSFEVWCRGG